MSNIGREYKSEMSRYADPKTGREIVKLTGKYQNYHIYFTDNSFNLGDKEIYFLSTRPYEDREVFNFFKMDLSTGLITQLTDEPNGIGEARTKTPDGEYLVYVANGKTVKKVCVKTGETTVLYDEPGRFTVGHPFISPDRKYVGFERNEEIPIEVGNNYTGFKETMFAIKRSFITIAYMDGSKHRDVFADTHWLGHFQFAPDDANIAMFCHEGPWNLVQQRIWILDTFTGEAIPCFRQEEDDSVGHEFWTRDGLIFFDNRMAGHDGTITVSRTQAVASDHAGKPGQVPYVGLANKQGEVIRRIDMPFYCNHYHANNDNTLLVGDEVDDLVLIDLTTPKAELTTLCNHGTSWNGQRTHCHPTWSWGADKILYTSDRGGACNLYLLEMK